MHFRIIEILGLIAVALSIGVSSNSVAIGANCTKVITSVDSQKTSNGHAKNLPIRRYLNSLILLFIFFPYSLSVANRGNTENWLQACSES